MQLVPDSWTKPLEPFLSRYVLAHDALNTLSFSLSAAGVLASIPAIMTGSREAVKLFHKHHSKIRGQGVHKFVKDTCAEARADPNSDARLMGQALVHASLNHAVVLVAAYNWSVLRSMQACAQLGQIAG